MLNLSLITLLVYGVAIYFIISTVRATSEISLLKIISMQVSGTFFLLILLAIGMYFQNLSAF